MPSQSATPEELEAELTGRRLYGDGLTGEDINAWYAKAEAGAFAPVADHFYLTDASTPGPYLHGALNEWHGLKALRGRRFECCLALGCGNGDDVAPLAPQVGRFIAIEPSKQWWTSSIGGKPAQYLMPSLSGKIDLNSGSVDLATSFGVLHRIPNVSAVVGEVARVLKPGSFFVVREPISAMGDWTQKRRGLRFNERGMPIKWFEAMARAQGFDVVRRRLCMLAPLRVAAKKMGFSRPYASMPMTVVDSVLSELLFWNVRYRRTRLVTKIAPASAFWLLQKAEDARA